MQPVTSTSASSGGLSRAYGRNQGMRYPSPFFDVASQYLPDNMLDLLKWCRFYFLTNPIINVAVSKLAEYPVTGLVYETEDEDLRTRYRDIEKNLGLRKFEVEVGLDYFGYGNAFVSIYTPFNRWLRCTSCGRRHLAKDSRSRYKWKNFKFVLTCAKCSHVGPAEVIDTVERRLRGVRLVRWNPENMVLRHNDVTGVTKYFYKIPTAIRNDVTMGDRDAIETLPLEFLEAIEKNRFLLFHPDGMYHLKRPTLAQRDQGWGTPLIYPLLRDAFYLQVMKKAQESLLMEHVVPLRVIFPGQSGVPEGGVFDTMNLGVWRSRIETELGTWRRDPNYIPILPIPVGYQQLGASAKALILHQEFRLHAEQMLAGAGIPVEFVFGGLQWSGTNTSLRALENMFTGYNRQREGLIVDFILGRIADFMRWPKINARFERFKMADDLQRSMFYFQLNQANKLSDRRLAEEIGEDYDKEIVRMDLELERQLKVQRRSQVAAADVAGEASLHTGRYQAKVQEITLRAQMKAQQEGLTPPPQPGADPAAAGQPGTVSDATSAAAPGDPEQKNETIPVPGVPGATVYAQNADRPNQSRAPTAVAAMGSQLGAAQMGTAQPTIEYVAQRVAAYLRTLGQDSADRMYDELSRLQTSDPNLYRLVVQLMRDDGSKVDPLRASAPAGSAPGKDPSRTIG